MASTRETEAVKQVVQDVNVTSEMEIAVRNVLEPKLRAELRAELEPAIRSELDAKNAEQYAIDLVKTNEELKKNSEVLIKAAVEKMRQDMMPPKTEDLQKLLEQEYLEFTVKIRIRSKQNPDPAVEQSEFTSKSFVIREMTQKIEKRMLQALKKVLVPMASEFASITLNLLEGDAAKKVVDIMNAFEPLLDCMASMCAVALDPYAENEEITPDWVIDNISSVRIMQIVYTQMQCNRMRDFFSLLSQTSKLVA